MTDVTDSYTPPHGRTLTGAQMAQLLDEFINGAGADKREEFIDYTTRLMHRTLQQKAMGLFIACVERWAEDRFGHDLRNEATVKLAQKIIRSTGDTFDRYLPFV